MWQVCNVDSPYKTCASYENHILSEAIQKNISCRELNQKLMEVESELDDMKNQKNAGEMEKDSELGKKYTDHL